MYLLLMMLSGSVRPRGDIRATNLIAPEIKISTHFATIIIFRTELYKLCSFIRGLHNAKKPLQVSNDWCKPSTSVFLQCNIWSSRHLLAFSDTNEHRQGNV